MSPATRLGTRPAVGARATDKCGIDQRPRIDQCGVAQWPLLICSARHWSLVTDMRQSFQFQPNQWEALPPLTVTQWDLPMSKGGVGGIANANDESYRDKGGRRCCRGCAPPSRILSRSIFRPSPIPPPPTHPSLAGQHVSISYMDKDGRLLPLFFL